MIYSTVQKSRPIPNFFILSLKVDNNAVSYDTYAHKKKTNAYNMIVNSHSMINIQNCQLKLEYVQFFHAIIVVQSCNVWFKSEHLIKS